MSQTKAQLLEGTTAQNVTVDNINTTSVNSGQLSSRNKIINGAMQVSQRGTSQAGANSSGYKNAPDRWRFNAGGSNVGTYTVSQSTDSPNGFSNSYKLDVTSTRTPASDERLDFEQRIEGQNLQDFAKGTSEAKQYTLSFYVKTDLSGDYVVALRDEDNDRFVMSTYTVSDGNWNRYTVTFPADTTGAFDNDANHSLAVKFVVLAGTNFTSGTAQTTWGAEVNANTRVGQTAQLSAASKEWYITGVQLEVGSTATDFEHRPYSHELALSQRYFIRIPDRNASSGYYFLAQGAGHDTNACLINMHFPVTMRANPSMSTPGSLRLYNGGGLTITSLILNSSSVAGGCLQIAASSGISPKDAVSLGQNNDSDAAVDFQAEL